MATPLSIPFPLTGDNVIDASTNGYYWRLGTDRTIRWSLSNGWNGEYWINPSAAAQQLEVLFKTVSYYANVNFLYAGYLSSPSAAANVSDINLTFDGLNTTRHFSSASSWAFGEFADATLNATWYDGAPGDIYVNLNSLASHLPTYAPGTQGYFLFLHEVMHTLGLKHPHDSGGTGRPTYGGLGWSGLDDDWFTVMSYNDDASWNYFGWDPATPMLIDVLALQYLYGKNMSTNAGDSTYTLPLNNSYVTIWDAGGTDDINVSSSPVGWTIVLPNTLPSKIVNTKAGLAVPTGELSYSAPHNLYWLTGDIENVIGSPYADNISGTDGQNVFVGGGGNDTINGAGGDDVVGFNLNRANYTIFKSGSTISVTAKSGFEGTDTLTNVEYLAFQDVVTDFDVSGISGEAYRLYQAAFNRKPDAAGLGWQISAMHKGTNLLQVAQNFVNSAEFKGLYGANPTNTDLVNLLYKNVLHRTPQQNETDFWVGILSGTNPNSHQTPAQVLASFSESPENQAQVIGSIQNGIDYVYYS